MEALFKGIKPVYFEGVAFNVKQNFQGQGVKRCRGVSCGEPAYCMQAKRLLNSI